MVGAVEVVVVQFSASSRKVQVGALSRQRYVPVDAVATVRIPSGDQEIHAPSLAPHLGI